MAIILEPQKCCGSQCLQLCDSEVKGSVRCAPLYACTGSPDGNCWVRAVWGNFANNRYYFNDLVNGYFGVARPDPAGRAFSVRCLFSGFVLRFILSFL